MSNANDGQTARAEPVDFSKRTEKAMASIERAKIKSERDGAMIGMAAGGFGRSTSGRVLGLAVKFIPLIAAAGFTVLAVYSLALSLS